jgi:hypothetical protein
MRWVPLKTAAASSEVHPVTLREWARAGLVLARRLARGHGPWRVAVDAGGLVLDGTGRPPRRA